MGDDPVVSHGRGGIAPQETPHLLHTWNAYTVIGQGNIGADSTEYVDGEIVRKGVVGESATDGAYSTGRGGAANISGEPPKGPRSDADDVPEVATRLSEDTYHTGRGGKGNVHQESVPEGLAEKLKRKIFGRKPEST
ncbi:MAG: hypothetical protein M1840_004047 [Geoglossum simile]|nr:MAG: hypothetical protein M1840_004047 [Geoglossum simile]